VVQSPKQTGLLVHHHFPHTTPLNWSQPYGENSWYLNNWKLEVVLRSLSQMLPKHLGSFLVKYKVNIWHCAARRYSWSVDKVMWWLYHCPHQVQLLNFQFWVNVLILTCNKNVFKILKISDCARPWLSTASLSWFTCGGAAMKWSARNTFRQSGHDDWVSTKYWSLSTKQNSYQWLQDHSM